jgi:hypothetical protein
MRNSLALMVLSLTIIVAGCSHPRPVAYYPPPPGATDIARQGFNAGLAAARHDIGIGAPPDVNRHPRFRHPPVPPPAAEEYRRSFRNGYERGIHPPPPV